MTRSAQTQTPVFKISLLKKCTQPLQNIWLLNYGETRKLCGSKEMKANKCHWLWQPFKYTKKILVCGLLLYVSLVLQKRVKQKFSWSLISILEFYFMILYGRLQELYLFGICNAILRLTFMSYLLSYNLSDFFCINFFRNFLLKPLLLRFLLFKIEVGEMFSSFVSSRWLSGDH